MQKKRTQTYSTETFGRPIDGGSDQDKSWGVNAHADYGGSA